jgi:hypothetical protein
MDGMLQAPAVTGFDAAASAMSLLVYLAVALTAMIRAPGDSRARVFLAVALTSAIPYALSPMQWWKGIGVYTPVVIAVTTMSVAIGIIALFHFTQIFPRLRPFAAARFAWIRAAYLVLPLPAAWMAWAVGAVTSFADNGSGGLGAVSVGFSLLLLLLLVPLILIVGVVVPCAGVLSLVKSWREAREDGRERDREATLWMLVSQLGGGILSILVLPMLHLVGVGPPWSVMIAALSYAFALLLPLAFLRYAITA